MAEVTLKDVTKVYGEDVVPIRDMNLDIPDGEFVVFVGPSGSDEDDGPAHDRRPRGHDPGQGLHR